MNIKVKIRNHSKNLMTPRFEIFSTLFTDFFALTSTELVSELSTIGALTAVSNAANLLMSTTMK